MRILMLTPYLPYPLFSGGQIRSYNIIKELSQNNTITLFSLIRNDNETDYISQLEKYCEKVVVFKRKKAFGLDNIFLACFTNKPFILHVYKNRELEEALLKELKREPYDLLHVETFYLMHNIPATNVPLILFEQNIEYDVYRRIAQYFQPPFLRPFLLLDVAKIKKWEEYFWKKVNALVVMSDSDKKFINRDAFVSGNGVDTEEFKPEARSPFDKLRASQKPEAEKRILFIGNFKWFENRDAARFLLAEIWPAFVKTSAGKPKIKLWIVGRNIPPSIKNLTTDPDVGFDEHASEDVREIYKQATILLAPLRAGGGTSFKVLQSMACGVPVVTTPSVAQAIGAIDGEQILTGSNEEELAAKTKVLLEDEELYKKVATNARRLVEQKYDWKILIKQIEEIYRSVSL